MTDKIKSAREAVESWVDDTFGQPSHILLCDHAKTILEALSAYERLQAVDLDILPKSIEIVTEHQAWRRGADIEMQDVKNLGIWSDDNVHMYAYVSAGCPTCGNYCEVDKITLKIICHACKKTMYEKKQIGNDYL